MNTSAIFKNLQHSAVKDYEDLVWRLAERVNSDSASSAASDSDKDESREYGSICWAAKKTIDELQQDVLAIHRRIELRPDIEESLAATDEREKLVAKRNQLEAEFDAVRQKHEAALASISSDISAQDKRLKRTADARRHYRQTTPQWLRDRAAYISGKLLEIHKRLGASEPRLNSDLSKNLLYQATGDAETRRKMEAAHEAAVQRHAEAVKRFTATRERHLSEQAELEREREGLKCVELCCLRPMPEDAQ